MAGTRELVDRFYDAFNSGDLEGARHCFADDMEYVEPATTLTGWDAFHDYLGVLKASMPDARLNPRSWIDAGDVVATEGTFTGTFTNPLPAPQGEIPPTGRSFELPFVEVNEAQGGRIVSHRLYYDQMTFLGALGVMPPQDASA